VDYKLGTRWWLVGEYDVFDDYNAGVKWRVISKGGKP
jgi:translocation and assembly module TamB